MAAPDLVLPEGGCLLHIGPHKTGTTTIQGAFHLARDRLAEHGVLYAGARRQAMHAALALTGRAGAWREEPPELRRWTALVDEVAEAGHRRAVVSSEFFADGNAESARRAVQELGGPRVRVVVTLRPLTRIIASQWQQYVQSGVRMPYAEWLDSMFNKKPYRKPTPSFWRRHSHDRLVKRWMTAAGPENVTVVVADESDPTMLVRTFESMLDLPAETLVPERERSNRSLTAGETELVRKLNEEFDLRDWPLNIHTRILRQGVVLQTKVAHQPGSDEPRITTPRWALEKAAAIGGQAAARIEKSGVHIVGDIASLGTLPADIDDMPEETVEASSLSIDSATHAVLGAIIASGVAEPEPDDIEDRIVRHADARGLAQVLVQRVRRRLFRTLGRVIRRRGR